MCIGQSYNPNCHLGNTFIFSNQLYSNQINNSGLLGLQFDISVNNNYSLKDLNQYRIGLTWSSKSTRILSTYEYTEENVFRKHNVNVGIQKSLSSNFKINVGVGLFNTQRITSSKTNYSFHCSFQYQIDSTVYIQNVIKSVEFGRESTILLNSTAVQYKVNEHFGATVQLNISNTTDGSLGLYYSLSKFIIHLEHNYQRQTFGLGVGFNSKFAFFNFVIYNHEVLGNSYISHIMPHL